MNTTALVVILTCFANVFLGLFVLLRNPKDRLGQSFFTMTALISAWAVSNYYTDNANRLQFNILSNKLAYLFALLALAMSALFTHYFLERRKKYSKILVSSTVVGLMGSALLSTTNYIAGTVTQFNGELHFTSGSLILFYLGALLVLLCIIIKNLYLAIKQGSPSQKNQGQIIIGSFTGCIVLAIITNLIIPVLSNNDFQAAKFGPPLLTLFLSTAITYAIVAKKLFDIRLVVARSVGYSLLLFALGAAYSLGAFTIGGLFFDSSTNSLEQQIYDISLALLLAFTFQPLKSFFQRITDSIFYRDKYDPQTLLGNLGTIMAREIELEQLTSDVVKELTSQMRLSKAAIVVLDNNKIFYESNVDPTNHKTIALDELQKIGDGIVINDSLDSGETKEIFNKYGLNVSVDLRSTNELCGYLLLGSKKSGDIFNQTDTKTLSILAHELAIAIHNAKSYTQIQNFNKTLQKRIEDATAQLRDANTHLKELDGIKNEFLSIATHQLNTPLSVVDGYLSMITDGTITDHTEQMGSLNKVLNRVRLMKRLVADFLNVTRIETGNFNIEPKPVDINKIVTEEINELGPTAHDKGVLLQFIAPKHPVPIIEIDEQKTRQAIMNLVDNAIYYTPKGTVKVYLETNKDNVIFKVIDNGIGVPESEKAKLFKKFSRAENAKRERPNGTGVGLYLVKLVVEGQGGQIIFESETGKGSTFGFSLPLKATTPPRQAQTPEELVTISTPQAKTATASIMPSASTQQSTTLAIK